MKNFLLLILAVILFSCSSRQETAFDNIYNTDLYKGDVINPDSTTVLAGATLINTNGDDPIDNSVIIIKQGAVVRAGKWGEVEIPENARIVNLKGKYIIPGLTDSHIHFFQSGGLYTRPDALDLRHRVSYEEEKKWIQDNIDDVFRRYIRCGITTVVDVGGPYWNFGIKQRAENTIIAPNAYLCGPLITPYMPEVFADEDPAFFKTMNPVEAAAEARRQIEAGADFIKLWYIVGKGLEIDDFYPAAKAVCDQAHELGVKVYVHATQLETAKAAVRAGCDVLVHIVNDKPVDEEFLNLLSENDITLMPTMWVFESYAAVYTKQLDLMKCEHLLGNPYVIGTLFDMHELDDSELGPRQRKLLAENKPIETSEIIINNVAALNKKGINIAAGTDAGNVGVLHGPALFHEFKWMKKAGMTNMEILKSATINAAEMLNQACWLGSIEKGKAADLVILNSNPLECICNCSDIYLTINDGWGYPPEEVIKNTAEDLAQIQLNAYNERDLEAFVSVYSPDVEIYNFPDDKIYSGRKTMRETYAPFFEKATKLHCRLVDRIILGNNVIDREIVKTGIEGRDTLEAIAQYKIEGGFIRKVWFTK